MTTEDYINELMSGRDTAIAKDLKLNLKRVLVDGNLDPEEAHLTLLSLATSVGHSGLAGHARSALADSGVDDDVIREAEEAAGLTAMLNIYYRFRHFVENTQGEVGAERYKRVGLRMNSMSKPVMGHERFEMLAFAVSVLNGCEMCVNGHEKKLLDIDVDVEKIHDLARLAALVRAIRDFGAGT